MATYAGERVIHDTDSHLMEPVDWLASYADSSVAAKLRNLSLAGGGDAATFELVEQCWARRDDPEETAKLAADVVSGPKGYFAYGSMDANERVGALDQLGFASQLVFTTFAHTQFHARGDVDLAYGGAAAHNRGIADFCSVDPRLLGVAFVPLEDARRLHEEAGITPDRHVVAYCGGGISATVGLFLLHQLGYRDLTLYDGSMGEWAQDPDLPIQTGPQEGETG